MIVDRCAAALADFVCGANENDQHYIGANWERDVNFTARGRPAQCGGGRPLPRRQGHA